MMMLVAATLLAAAVSSPSMPPGSADEIPKVIGRLKASYGPDSWAAADRLVALGAPALPALVAVLNDRTLGTVDTVAQSARLQAARTIGRMAQTGVPAVPVLLALLRDRAEDDGVRGSAAEALGAIAAQPEDVISALIAVIDEKGITSGLSFSALLALRALAKAPSARPALEHALPQLRQVRAKYAAMESACWTVQGLFRVFEPPTEQRLAEEDDIRVFILRQRLKDESETWCLGPSVSDAVFGRLAPLQVSRNYGDCRDVDALLRTSRSLSLGTLCWMSDDRVLAAVSELATYMHGPRTDYVLQRGVHTWQIVSEIKFGR